ncbi:MAG: hypothetical protein AAF554_03660 [Bacteroidota bacterium]
MNENDTDKLVSHFPITIRDAYGSNKNLAKILDQGIEMLFYLEEDAFDRKEVQNMVAALRDIAVVLRQTD